LAMGTHHPSPLLHTADPAEHHTAARSSLHDQPHPPPRPTLFPYTTLFRSGHYSRMLADHARYVLALDLDPSTVELLYRARVEVEDRKSTRLNSSHVKISYAVFCLKKKNLMFNHTSRSKEHTSELQARLDLV